MTHRNNLDGSSPANASVLMPLPHIARRLALEAEVLARLAADRGLKVSEEERAEGLLFDSG